MTGTTKTGFEYTVDPTVFDNMRVLNGLRKMQNAPKRDYFVVDEVCELILGKEQYAALTKHLEDISDDGVAHIAAFVEEFSDIMTGSREAKK